MKRILLMILTLTFCLSVFAGCATTDKDKTQNTNSEYKTYILETDGNDDKIEMPYIRLNTKTSTFTMGEAQVISFAINGTYTIENNVLTATTSADDIYRFEIGENDSLIFRKEDSNDNSFLTENMKFVCELDN